MVTDAWQVFDSTAADENNRVLLQVVAFATNVGSYFIAVSKPYTTNLTQG
jgi:hypothetical protein